MADIEYVIPGQAVRASTINSIIDSLGGPYTPASEPDIGFERTPYGSIFTSQTNVEGAPAYISPQFLDVAWGTSLSGQQELMINLGRDLQTALKLLPSNPTAVFFRDFSGSTVSKSSMLKLSADSFQPNGAGKYFDGWIGTGIYSLEKAGSEEAGDTSTAVLDGCLYMYDMQGDDGNACVIANSTSYKPFESELKSITGWKIVTMKSKTAIATQTSASLKSGTASAGASLIRIHNAVPEIETENYLFKLRANVETREEGGSKQKRAVIEYWDNSDTTGGGVKWNTYAFKSQSSQAGGAHWQELSATEWAESIPEFDLTAWLKVSANGDSQPELTSDYITNGEWVVTLEKKDDETCYIGGLVKGGLGTRQVVAYYPIGRVHNHSLQGHDNMFVEQCMLGSFNTLDMSWGGEGGGGSSGGDDSQRFTADSLLSSAEMSSLTRNAYTYKYAEELSTGEIEYKEATGYYFSLYNFKHAEGAIDLSLSLSNDFKLPDRYKVLVRDNQEKLGQPTKPVLKYATLSVEVPAMSVDSGIQGTNSWSVQLSAEHKGHGVTQLFNFTKEQEDGTYKFDKKNSSLSDDNLILARVKGDDGYKLKYMKLEVNGLSDVIPLSNMLLDLSANVQADTKVEEAKTKSVDKGNYTATVNHIDLSGNVKQEQVNATYFKLYNFESDEAVDKDKLASLNDYTVLVKKADGESKELHYMALSSFRDLSVDTQDQQLDQKSIEKVQNGKMLQLYRFNKRGLAKISLDKDHNYIKRSDLEVLVRSRKDGVKQLDYASLSIAFPESRDLSADTEVTSSGTKSIDCSLSVLSLHNFKGSSNDIHLSIKDGNNKTQAGTSLLVREGNELKYADLEVTFPQLSDQSQKSQLSGMFKADAASGKGLSSISEMWDGNTKIFSAYKFNDNEYHVADKKDAGANADVLVRDRDSRVLKYVDLSSFTGDISCDSDSLYSEQFTEKRASLEKASDGLYQLYGFDLTGSTATVTLTPAHPKMSDDWQLVTRHKDGDTTNLIYADLSVAYHKGDDASIQEDQQDKSKLQLLDWASHSTVALKKVDGVAYEALVKDVNTGKLAYASLDISSSGSTYVDSEKSSVARSLEKVVPQNGDPYLMVNGFDTAENVQKSDLSTHQDDYDVLLRHRNGGLVEMSYASLKDIQLSGAAPASEINYNWMWRKDAEGNYVKPGAGTMVGYYLYGNVMRYVSKTIPAGSGFLHLVITYGTPSTTEGGSTPASESLQWKNSYYTSPSLTSISIPLWYHDGTDPTLDMRAGLFTVPVYA